MFGILFFVRNVSSVDVYGVNVVVKVINVDVDFDVDVDKDVDVYVNIVNIDIDVEVEMYEKQTTKLWKINLNTW